jgi:hypothetical protein
MPSHLSLFHLSHAPMHTNEKKREEINGACRALSHLLIHPLAFFFVHILKQFPGELLKDSDTLCKSKTIRNKKL